MRIAPSFCPLLSLSLSLSLSLVLFLFVRLQDRSYLYLPSLLDIVPLRSVPDLFFFCLNLVAIRGGHTPRQGRVCTRAPIEEPLARESKRNAHMRVHVCT